MSDRMKLLEAVAEAAREYVEADGKGFSLGALESALSALDALPAQPQGETVTLAVWRDGRGAAVTAIAGSEADTLEPYWRRLGTVTLPLNTEPRP